MFLSQRFHYDSIAKLLSHLPGALCTYDPPAQSTMMSSPEQAEHPLASHARVGFGVRYPHRRNEVLDFAPLGSLLGLFSWSAFIFVVIEVRSGEGLKSPPKVRGGRRRSECRIGIGDGEAHEERGFGRADGLHPFVPLRFCTFVLNQPQ